jgi:acyl-CoA synthetase (AMP-forming)/AMP-acid ligase II
MNGTAARHEADEILAELPDRISDIIKPFARQSPDHPALVQGDVTWSYAELAAVVADTALILNSYDVRPGDRVMIVSENSLALVALILAAAEIDAWSVAVNPRLSAREVDLIREHSGARRVFYAIEVSDAARRHAERHDADIAVLRGLGPLGVGPLNRDTAPEPVEADRSRQVAALVYTSGTTGNPKGVMLTHRNLLFSARVVSAQREPTDKVNCILPISHIVGYSNILIASLMAGATVELVPRFDPAALVAAIANDGITLMFGVPATYQRLLEYKTVAGIDRLPRGKLRRLGVAGAPLDVTLKSKIEAEFGLPLSNGYGITECAPAIAAVRAPRSDDAVGSLIAGIEARLVAPAGRPVAPGEAGELHVRGPNVMRGYYRAPEATAAVIDADGWFNTGDLARFDGDILYVVGRTKELIIRSGFNVYPAEVEAVLNEHPAVVQSAVIGRAVAGNEEVVAFVQPLPGSTVKPVDLMAYAARRLAPYKRPCEIIMLDELPAGSTGKILKHNLADATRDRVLPAAGNGYRNQDEAAAPRPNFLFEEIEERAAKEPVTSEGGIEAAAILSLRGGRTSTEQAESNKDGAITQSKAQRIGRRAGNG